MGPFEDKYNVNEGETVFVTLKLEPGDPIPTSEQIEWIKNGSKDMSVFPRCKLYTNGENTTGPSPSSPPSALPRLSSSSSSS